MLVSAINRTSLGGTYTPTQRRIMTPTKKTTNHKTTQLAYSKSFTVFFN